MLVSGKNFYDYMIDFCNITGREAIAPRTKQTYINHSRQDLLFEVKKREKEVSLAVKSLEQELAQEYAEYDKEVKFTMQELRTLKEELQKNKAESRILLNTEEKKLKAQEQGLARMLGQKEVICEHSTDEMN